MCRLASRGLEAVDVCTSSCNITRLVHTGTHERGKYKQDKTASSTCWSLGLQLARLPLAAVVFKLDNCFTRLPCGLWWGPVTGKRIFHPGRSKLDLQHHQ